MSGDTVRLMHIPQVAYGYSRFCELFTYEEWIGFSYSVDLFFSGASGFQSKTGVSVQKAQHSVQRQLHYAARPGCRNSKRLMQNQRAP